MINRGQQVDRPLFETLEVRSILSGVTIVTHGYQASEVMPPWVGSMALEIADRLDGAFGMGSPGAAVGGIVAYHDAGVVKAFAQAFDVAPQSVATGEMVLTLDWSSIAQLGDESTSNIGSVIAASLATPGFFAEIEGTLLSHPIHLIGHSRGASLVGAIAHSLGELGAWVEQTTFLDWHPTSGDYGHGEQYAVTENVMYADAYYQQESNPFAGFINGAPIWGAFNRDLSFGLSNGSFNPHSDVHLWYHATVDVEGGVWDGDLELTGEQRAAWFHPNEAGGLSTGFGFSRTGGVNRGSYVELAQVGLYPAQGLHPLLGGNRAAQTPVNWAGAAWPNVAWGSVESSGQAWAGQVLELSALVVDADSGGQVALVLDRDLNAENDNEELVAPAGSFAATGAEPGAWHGSVTLPAGVTPGQYFVAIAVTDGSKARLIYLNETVSVVAPPEPARLTVMGGTALDRPVIADAKASRGNGSGFGPQIIVEGGKAHTFRLRNDGGQPLDIHSVRLGGQMPDQFDLSWSGPGTLTPGGAIDLIVWFDPSVYGTARANFAVVTGGQNPQTQRFKLRGVGMPSAMAPDVEVAGNGESIRSGDRKARAGQGTKFGQASVVGAEEVTREFTVRSVGGGPVTLSGDVGITGPGASSFRVESSPTNLTLYPGQEFRFRLVFRPVAGGKVAATIELLSDDPDESPFTFKVAGFGV